VIRLVVFDCDGTLVDSQFVIFEAMRRALQDHGQPVPPLAAVRAVVGLSLVEAVGDLVPELPREACAAVAASYKTHFRIIRAEVGVQEPLFAGVREVLAELQGQERLIGMATGKSRRGLAMVLAHHGLEPFFVTLQTADDHPSKPHPAMLERAMDETGCRPDETLLVGDTTFDVRMAQAAGVSAIGVAWGYHPVPALRAAGARQIVESFPELLDAVGTRS
jgi:phosphoglycolate phosphatase